MQSNEIKVLRSVAELSQRDMVMRDVKLSTSTGVMDLGRVPVTHWGYVDVQMNKCTISFMIIIIIY